MRSNISDLQRLKHVYDACDDIQRATKNLSKADFLNDFIVRAAVCNFITVVGEAVANLSDDFKLSHEEFDWKSVKGMRNIIVHQYFGIDYEQIWDAVENDIPILKENIKKAITEFE